MVPNKMNETRTHLNGRQFVEGVACLPRQEEVGLGTRTQSLAHQNVDIAADQPGLGTGTQDKIKESRKQSNISDLKFVSSNFLAY